MKKLAIFSILALFVFACGESQSREDRLAKAFPEKAEAQKKDDGKGIGEITSVTLNNPLDAKMVENGKAIYELKCAACHKLTDQRVVGPGWAGLTDKRKPEWIMNMITNVEIMLEEDKVANDLLKECLVRMPNQNISITDARDILEFIYQNDLDFAASQGE